MEKEQQEEVRVGVLFGQKTGNAIVEIVFGKFQKQMPIRDALHFANVIFDACTNGLMDETLVKFMTSLDRFSQDEIGEALAGFRYMRAQRDPRVVVEGAPTNGQA